mmetsp:Transcript_25659/g.66326  ORF Transcript_25659/g.66326 Transcript_25659/m.66326 type:complete len:434 (-) Transcript_25659:319-1620(-)
MPIMCERARALPLAGSNFLKENLKYDFAVYSLVGLTLTMISSWNHLLSYRSRFEAKSGVHRAVDAIEGLAFAASCHNIVPDATAFEEYHMHVMVSFVIMSRAVQALRRLELILMSPEEPSHTSSARLAALDNLVRLALEMACLSVAYAMRTIAGVMAVLTGTFLVGFGSFLVQIIFGLFSRRWVVPVHVEFTVTRLGEMVMLMLGEGMLSLVISETYVDYSYTRCEEKCTQSKLKSGTSFASGFLLLSALMYIYYRSNPFARHHHAVRRKAIRGVRRRPCAGVHGTLHRRARCGGDSGPRLKRAGPRVHVCAIDLRSCGGTTCTTCSAWGSLQSASRSRPSTRMLESQSIRSTWLCLLVAAPSPCRRWRSSRCCTLDSRRSSQRRSCARAGSPCSSPSCFSRSAICSSPSCCQRTRKGGHTCSMLRSSAWRAR